MTCTLKHLAALVVEQGDYGPRPYVALENLQSGAGRLTLDELPQRDIADTGSCVVEPGDVLFGKLRPYLAKTWLVDRSVYASTELMALRPSISVEPRWLHYLVSSSPVIEWAVASSEGTKMPRTSWEKLRSMVIPDTPSLARQQAIADYLDAETARIDALIEKKQRMVGLLREEEVRLREDHFLLGYLPDESDRFDGRWVHLIPPGWKESPIKHLAECTNSGAWGEESGVEEVDLRVATTAQIDSDGQFRVGDMEMRSFSSLEANRYRCRSGDIVVVKSSGSATNIVSGKAGLVSDEDFVFSNFLMRLRPNRDLVEPEFLYLALVSDLTRQRIERMVSATTYPNLQVGEYLSSRIPVPPLNVQRSLLAEYAETIGRIDTLRRKHELSIGLLRERRQAVVTEAVTGEFALPGVAA